MPAELLPSVVAVGKSASSFKQKLESCRARYEDEIRRFDCCRRCDSQHCVPCHLDPAVQAVEERYQSCRLKAWYSTLLKLLPEATVEAIVSTLPEFGPRR